MLSITFQYSSLLRIWFFCFNYIRVLCCFDMLSRECLSWRVTPFISPLFVVFMLQLNVLCFVYFVCLLIFFCVLQWHSQFAFDFEFCVWISLWYILSLFLWMFVSLANILSLNFYIVDYILIVFYYIIKIIKSKLYYWKVAIYQRTNNLVNENKKQKSILKALLCYLNLFLFVKFIYSLEFNVEANRKMMDDHAHYCQCIHLQDMRNAHAQRLNHLWLR